MPLLKEVVEWLDYAFTVYEYDVSWHEVGGLYVFAGPRLTLTGNPRWHAFYVGRTHSFSERIPTHEKWSEAVQLGATHLHARVEPRGLRQGLIETELIDRYQPELNVLLK